MSSSTFCVTRTKQDSKILALVRAVVEMSPVVDAAERGPLLELCAGRKSTEPLFGDVDCHWVGYHVRRLCKAAGVPEVCPHGLRGTQASISVLAVPAEHVAAALGQTGPAVTRRHYLASWAEERRRGRAALKVIEGGKR